MRKKILVKSILFLVSIILLLNAASILNKLGVDICINAQAYFVSEDGNYYYDVLNHKVIIMGYMGNDDVLIVPDMIDECEVIGIGNFAFSNGKFTEIYLPESVSTIGAGAFSSCQNLKKVSLPNSLESLGLNGNDEYVGAFEYCDNLEEIVIPDKNEYYKTEEGVLFDKSGKTLLVCPNREDNTYEIPNEVEKIAINAFSNAMYLEYIQLSDSVADMDADDVLLKENPFAKCAYLKEIVVSDKNEKYKTEEGVLFDKEGKILISYPAHKSSIVYDVPKGVEKIEAGAFEGGSFTSKLQSIGIPDSVKEIGIGVFASCEKLSEIIVDTNNQNYKSIDGVLFDKSVETLICWPNNRKIIYYAVPFGVTKIEYNAFTAPNYLKYLDLPDTLKEIYDSNINSIYGIEKVRIPRNVNMIKSSTIFNGSVQEIYGYEESYAETYAQKKKIVFRTIKEKTSNDGIMFTYFDEQFNDDVEFQTQSIDKDDVKNLLSIKDVDLYAYDMKLSNEVAEFNELVTINVPCPKEYDISNCKIYYVEKDGTLKNMFAQERYGSLVFYTKKLGTFLITEQELKSELEDVIEIAVDLNNFPDLFFCNQVNAYDLDKNGYLSKEERLAVTEMNITSSITSFEGIQFFENITTLIFENQVWNEDSIKAISELKKLAKFCLKKSEVGNLDLSQMENLQTVSLNYNDMYAIKLNEKCKAEVSGCGNSHYIYNENGEKTVKISEFSGLDTVNITNLSGGIKKDEKICFDNNVVNYDYDMGNGNFIKINLYLINGTDEKISWIFDNDELIISGSEEIPSDFCNCYDNSISKYVRKVKKIIIEEGITVIGANAFESFVNCTEIVIPKTCEQIYKDVNTGISIMGQTQFIVNGIKFNTKNVTENKKYSTYKESVKNLGEINQLFDISFTLDDKVVQPSETLKIAIPIPKKMSSQGAKVYHIDENGNLEDMNAVLENNNVLTFYTSHFSVYAIVGDKSILSGDINGDGKINIQDSALLRRHLAGWNITIDEEVADVDGNEKITLLDAALIRRYLAGWNVELK